MLLYSLLADSKLCSITALSRILEPVEKELKTLVYWNEVYKYVSD